MSPRHRALTLVALAALAGCGGGGARGGELPAPGMCAPVEGSLAAGATLAGRDGAYSLQLYSTDGSRSVAGTLVLRPRAAGQTSRGSTGTPLDGTAEIELTAVGAQAVTGLGSADSAAPGVLVLESEGADGRVITVRFGSAANRAVDSPIDGAFAVLDVTRLGNEGFFGAWRSGVRTERSTGYFCAWPRD